MRAHRRHCRSSTRSRWPRRRASRTGCHPFPGSWCTGRRACRPAPKWWGGPGRWRRPRAHRRARGIAPRRRWTRCSWASPCPASRPSRRCQLGPIGSLDRARVDDPVRQVLRARRQVVDPRAVGLVALLKAAVLDDVEADGQGAVEGGVGVAVGARHPEAVPVAGVDVEDRGSLVVEATRGGAGAAAGRTRCREGGVNWGASACGVVDQVQAYLDHEPRVEARVVVVEPDLLVAVCYGSEVPVAAVPTAVPAVVVRELSDSLGAIAGGCGGAARRERATPQRPKRRRRRPRRDRGQRHEHERKNHGKPPRKRPRGASSLAAGGHRVMRARGAGWR